MQQQEEVKYLFADDPISWDGILVDRQKLPATEDHAEIVTALLY